MSLRGQSAAGALGGLPLSIANGGTGQATAALAFGALKQAASTSATGVVELATTAEAIAGTSASVDVTAQALGQSGSARMGIIAYGTALDFAIDTDQALTFVATPTLWVPTNIFARRVSGAYNTACLGGVYTAASKGGTAIVAAAQTYAGLTGAGKIQSMTLAAVNLTDINTSTTLFLSLSTANGAALTADVFVYGMLAG